MYCDGEIWFPLDFDPVSTLQPLELFFSRLRYIWSPRVQNRIKLLKRTYVLRQRDLFFT